MSARGDDQISLGPWKGQTFLSVGRALYLGPAGETTEHAHHAVQVCVAMNTPFSLSSESMGWRDFDGVVVAANVPHALNGRLGDLVILYAEPESTDGRRLLGTGGKPVRELSPTEVSRVRASVRETSKLTPEPPHLNGILADLTQSVGLAPVSTIYDDKRIERAIELLRSSSHDRTPIPELARRVGLSASRFRYLFRRQVGMSAQSYILWLRIYEGCAALARGASLSEAAQHSGFSDAAHFTRTFRRTFGLAPSQLAGRLTLVG